MRVPRRITVGHSPDQSFRFAELLKSFLRAHISFTVASHLLAASGNLSETVEGYILIRDAIAAGRLGSAAQDGVVRFQAQNPSALSELARAALLDNG